MSSIEINLHQVMEQTKGRLTVVEAGYYKLEIGEELSFEYDKKYDLIRAVTNEAFQALRERESVDRNQGS